MANLVQLVQFVLSEPAVKETDWLEWKSRADLGQRLWQARAARFILAAANRPRASAAGPHEGQAFLVLGVEPGQAHGTNTVDPAVVGQGLARYLGTVGPAHSLEYVAVQGVTVAVVIVPPPSPGTRPYLARGTLSADRPEIQDGRIYIRRSGISTEASAGEIDEMLAERVATRVAAGPLWPMQAEPAWRDGKTIHVQRHHGDRVVIHTADTFTNLAEMAALRPPLPETLPSDIAQRVAVFDSLLGRADIEPHQAVEAAWSPLEWHGDGTPVRTTASRTWRRHQLGRWVRPVQDDHLPRWQAAAGGAAAALSLGWERGGLDTRIRLGHSFRS
jgi:hypothetical protein